MLGALLRKLTVGSFCMMWMSGGVLGAQLKAAANEIQVSDSIYVSLPVFVTSIIATAIFTWTVAKYDNKKVIEIQELRKAVHTLIEDNKKSKK